MPIYAYKCAACGFAKDVLQKISAAPLTVCPSCGAERFAKQVTAAGFRLKGSGWYVTDFRNEGNGGAKDGATDAGKSAAAETSEGASASTGSAEPAASSSVPAASPAPAAAAPPPAAGSTSH